MNSSIGNKLRLVLIGAWLLIPQLGAGPVYADVILQTSYKGTWQATPSGQAAYLNYAACPSTTDEQQLEHCLDTTANMYGNTIVVPWAETSDINSVEDWLLADPALPHLPGQEPAGCGFVNNSQACIAQIYMTCPDLGSPDPVIFGDEGAEDIRGWCLILGEAPPPAPPYVPLIIPAGPVNPTQTTGDPIDAGSGNVYYEFTDYKSGGAFPVEFTRSYNSSLANQAVPVPGVDQSLGIGWTSNLTGPHLAFNTTQEFYTCEYPDGSGNPVDYICPTLTFPIAVTVWGSDGSQQIFTGEIGNHSDTPETTVFTPQPSMTGQLSFGPLPQWLQGFLDNGVRQAYMNGYTYLRNDGYTEYYSASGLILTVADPHGSQVIYGYDSNDKLIQVWGQGLAWGGLNITYDSDGRIQTVGGYTYGYDTAGNLTQVTYPDGTSIKYLYEDPNYPHALTGVVDEDNNRYASWSYDGLGRGTSSQHAGGADNFVINSYNTDVNNDILSASVTEPTGLVRTLTFSLINGKNLVTSVSAPCSECGDKRQTISYDSSGFVLSETDFDGNVTLYTHDSAGRETSRIEASGTQYQRTITTQWNTALNLPEQITEYNAANQQVRNTSHCYNSSNGVCNDSTAGGNVWTVAVADPSSDSWHTTALTYQGGFGLAAVQGPRTDLAQITQYEYYSGGPAFGCGNPAYAPFFGLEIQDAVGVWTTIPNFDQNGMPLTICHEGGQTTTLTYDKRQRVLSRKFGTETTQYSYDPAGNLTQEILPTGGYLNLSYDAAHRLTTVTDSSGAKIVYTLDSLGNRINEQTYDANGNLTRSHQRLFDNLNHLVEDIGGANQTSIYTYDLDGNRLSTKDPNGNLTTNSYDSLNRIISVTNSIGSATYAMDSLDHLTSVTDPRGLKTVYSPDAFGDMLEIDSPDTGTTKYRYDAAGDVLYRTDADGNSVSFLYDALNRVTSRFANGNSKYTVTYKYNNNGSAGSAGGLQEVDAWVGTANANTVWLSYDGFGNLVSKEFQFGGSSGISESVSYGYDSGNNLISTGITPYNVAGPNQYINYQRDGLGQITSVIAKYLDGTGIWRQYALANNIKYEPFGPVADISYGNGLVETRTFDQDYRLTGIAVPRVMGLGYTYDADGNVISVTDSVVPKGQNFAQTLGYDSLSRLTSATGSYGGFTYAYDADGNLTSRTTVSNGQTRTFQYGSASSQLLKLTGPTGAVTNFSYDADGSRTADGTYSYNYDPTERLAAVTNKNSGASVATYVYDGLGERIYKSAGTTISYFLDDPSGHLLAEFNAGGAIRNVYAWLGDKPIANFGGNITAVASARFMYADNLNSLRTMADSTGTITWAWASDPFGSGTPVATSYGNNLRLPGQYDDVETGNYHNGFRDYDSNTDRYLESDPIGLVGGINTYAYVNDNPIRFVDPFGLCPKQPKQPQEDPAHVSTGDCIRNALLNTFGQDAVDRVEEHGLFITPNALNNGINLATAASAESAAGNVLEHALGIELEPLILAHDIYEELDGLKAANEYNLARMQCMP